MENENEQQGQEGQAEQAEQAQQPTTTPERDDHHLEGEEIGRLISFDPFSQLDSGQESQEEEEQEETGEEEGEEQAAQAGQQQQEGQAQQQQRPQEGQQAGQQQGQAPAPEGDNLLKEQNRLLLARIRQLEGRGQQGQGQEQGQQRQQQQQEALPNYSELFSTVRPEVLQGLQSDDPADVARAVSSIATGVASAVHATVRSEYRQHMDRAVQGYVQRHMTSSQTEQAIFQDFYGKYPDLNTPVRRAVVMQVAQGIINEGEPWNAEVRDRIAQETAKELGLTLPTTVPAPEPSSGRQTGNGQQQAAQQQQSSRTQQQQRQRRGPPAQITPNSRPGVAGPNQADDIRDTLFGDDRRARRG